MAISGSWNNDFNNKSQYNEYKNCFETQEGIYKLIYSTDLSSHDRETHNVNNINTNTPVRLSFLNRKKMQNSDEIEMIDESQTDMICVNFGKELYVYPFDNYNINQENLSPLDKRLYKCTFPTCHDFNKTPSKSVSILLIVGFTGGQIQLIDPIKKDQCKLFNEERHIDKTLVTCIKWVPSTPNQFLVSHASGYLYLYNEDLPCGALAPTYQVFKQGCKYCIYTCKTKSTRNPLYRWEFESPEYSSSSYGIEKYVNNYSGLSHSVSSLLSSSRYCAINEFAFSPSGQWLAIASQDGFLRIFDYHKMELQGSMRSYFGGIICLDWSADDKFIVVGGQDDLVTIWSVQDQVVVCRGQGHKSWVSTVKFDPFMCPSNDNLPSTRNNSATDTSENNEENLQATKNTTDIMNSNTYRFGSVGQDTLLCLWELTEDVIRQALKFSNNQREKFKNDCSKINNNDESYIINSDYLSSNSSATIPKIKLKGSLLKTTKLITNNQNESNHHLNNQSNYSTASLSQKFVHSLGGILGNGSSNIDKKHFTFSGGSVSFKSNQKLSFSVIIFVFMATSHSIHSNKPMAISVSLFRNLPPDIDRPFNVTVNFSSYHKINSAFIVYLVNKSETPPKMMQNFIFRPGSQTKIKGFIIGEYFSVVHCLSKTEEKQLKLDLILHEKAQNLVLLMFYSMNYKENATNNNGTEIYQSVISCNVSYLVDMKLVFGKSHVNEEAFPPNQLIWINCSASIEHQPYWKSVRLENLDQMEVFDVKINNRTKETSILAEITLKNHDSLIVCRSVNSTISRRIKIYHHPTSVKTSPSVASRSSIPYNVSITCVTTGGYPPPIVEWKLIIGPLNASRYYTLNKNKTVLVITKKAPPGSKWIFQCFAKNKLPWSEFSGPEMIVSFNIPELGLEARKKVFFVIPVAIIFLLFLVTVLKVHFCKQGKVLQKSKQLDWNMKSKTFEKNELKFLKTDEVFTEHLEMASDITSTTYSIEKGLTAQTFYVLDESRYDIEERLPSKKSLKDTQSWIDSIESEKDAIQI